MLACTLTPAALRTRQAETTALARRFLKARHGEVLVFDPRAEPALRELIAAEARCCPFLGFELRRAGDALELTISGPREMIPELFS